MNEEGKREGGRGGMKDRKKEKEKGWGKEAGVKRRERVHYLLSLQCHGHVTCRY